MGQRVLLISINRCVAPDPVFPLGLAHLCGALETAGHETRCYDVQMHTEPLTCVLREFKPHLVGISVRNIDDVLIRRRETYYGELNELCASIRTEAKCPVVIGGSGFSIFPDELLELSGADYGIRGAGEIPLIQLINALERDGHPVSIPGVLRKGGEGQHTGGQRVHDHCSTTLVSRDPALARHYISAAGMLNVQTQRGCAFHCCYCTYPVIEGRAHRRVPAEEVAEEFARVESLGAKYLFLVDSVFNSSPRHVTDVCEAILRRGTKLRWGCFLRPQGLTTELMGLMARAGLAHVEFGSDSFCDSVLVAYHKGLTFSDIANSSALARRHNVDFCHFLIIGGPSETEATLEESFENSKLLEGAVVMAVVGMRVYPGTELHARAVAEGRLRPERSLLEPFYYVSPHLSQEHIFERLQGFAQKCPNWIVGDPAPGFNRIVQRFRHRGVVGPLWSYLSVIQRFWPAGTGPLPGHPAAETTHPAATKVVE